MLHNASSLPLSLPPSSFSAGLHRRAGVQGPVSRGGRLGGPAGPLEPPGGEEHGPARGGDSKGQGSARPVGRVFAACVPG